LEAQPASMAAAKTIPESQSLLYIVLLLNGIRGSESPENVRYASLRPCTNKVQFAAHWNASHRKYVRSLIVPR
jgi:hypothetical protein